MSRGGRFAERRPFRLSPTRPQLRHEPVGELCAIRRRIAELGWYCNPHTVDEDDSGWFCACGRLDGSRTEVASHPALQPSFLDALRAALAMIEATEGRD